MFCSVYKEAQLLTISYTGPDPGSICNVKCNLAPRSHPLITTWN
ncbi:hypothetical protein XENTR_v10000159 [Xenopus tropicalis]|nr:hypothetical protein XENTR_v10000159 [Xenopus tropicalis]